MRQLEMYPVGNGEYAPCHETKNRKQKITGDGKSQAQLDLEYEQAEKDHFASYDPENKKRYKR
jgi:hypothetical protein